MKRGTNGFKRKYLILISSDRVNEALTLYEFYFLFFMEKIAAEIIHSTRVSSPDDVTIALSAALHHHATGHQSAR